MKKFNDNLKLFFSNKLGLIGTVILVGFILVAIFAPQIAPYDPYQRIGVPFGKPSMQNWLGTNDVGQDILSEVIYGTRISLLMGLLSAGVALIIGTIVGLTSGFFGGRIDT
ncbi:MAG TPA: ABC transporter permease, partial [Clostridiales bacterium]|nr:ABC transporter permease [Clostridiales bacterium]